MRTILTISAVSGKQLLKYFKIIQDEVNIMRSFKFVIALFAVLLMWPAPIATAQNFAKTAGQNNLSSDPQSEIAEADLLHDDEIENILKDAGIPLTAQKLEENTSKYTLGVNDVIEVEISRHPEVSGQYVLNNEGKIQYEFVGDVELAGLTKQEATQKLKEELGKFIILPEVLVKIAGYNSKIVYVVGEVGHPGKIYMQGDTITVREALVQAGLPLLSAKTTKGSLITPSADGNPFQKNFNVYKLLYKGDLRENLVMQPGDTLYLPPTIMAKALRVIQPVATPISEAAGAGRTVTTGF